MNIAILDDYQGCIHQLDCFKMLDGHEVKVFTNSVRGAGQLVARLMPFDAVVLIRERTALTRAVLEKLPALKLISQTGKVSGHIDVATATMQRIAIAEGVGDPTAPAELTWALIMAVARRIPQYSANLKAGLWQQVAPHSSPLGVTLKGRTLGIWGYGKIGRMVAGYGKAFGMKIMVWGRDASLEQAQQDGHTAAANRQAFFSTADFVSLHLRSVTPGIVTAEDLAHMKPDAAFINTSRARLVAHGALEAALQQGRPGFAGLDVFETEPLPQDSPLLQMHNIVATPHLGYVEKDSYERYFHAAFQNIIDFANGKPKNLLNPEVLA